MDRQAKANVVPKRQPNQYSCVATSMSMALQALGIPEEECSTERVNKVLGAMPLQGASWEQAAGAASHFGCRVTLVIPATLNMVRQWTDKGLPVLIGWNTGNEWSHASLIFHVDDQHVHIADPNIPNPDQTVRVLTHDDFYGKWWETASEGYKIRRPAMLVEREITQDGRQMVASRPGPHWNPWPQKKGTLKDEIEFLEWFVNHAEHLHGDEATQKRTAQVFKDLAGALKKEDQQAAKKLVSLVPEVNSSILTNGIWSFVLDGRIAKQQQQKESAMPTMTARVTARYLQASAQATLDAQNRLHVNADMVRVLQQKFHGQLMVGTPRGGFTLMLDNPESKDPGGGRDDVVDYYFLPDPDAPGGFRTTFRPSGIYGDIRKTLLQEFQAANIKVVKQASSLRRQASTPRYCKFYKARNGDWYMELADRERGDREDSTTYGPFYDKEDAMKFLDDNFSNPAGYETEDDGTLPVPTRSPNGDPVVNPRNSRNRMFWGAANYSGNPDGKPIYPNTIDHGTDTEPLSGGTDIMRRLQNQLLHEQGTDDLRRPESPKVASVVSQYMARVVGEMK